MQKSLINQNEMKIIGLKTRTNNLSEMRPETGQIGPLVAQYDKDVIANKIPHRKHPGVTFGVYTNYHSNEHGDYDYIVGEEVNSLDEIPAGLVGVTIPAGKYVKFTTPVGKIPAVVIEAWQQIWKMTDKDFGAKRAFKGDFEVYDQGAADPNHAMIDIYISLQDPQAQTANNDKDEKKHKKEKGHHKGK